MTENPNTATVPNIDVDLSAFDATTQMIGKKILSDIAEYKVLEPTIKQLTLAHFVQEVETTWDNEEFIALKARYEDLKKRYDETIRAEADTRFEAHKNSQDESVVNKLASLKNAIKTGLDYVKAYNGDAFNVLSPLYPRSKGASKSAESPNGEIKRIRGFDFVVNGQTYDSASKAALDNKLKIESIQQAFFDTQATDDRAAWVNVEFVVDNMVIQANRR